MKRAIAVAFITVLLLPAAFADCVIGAKEETTVRLVDANTILLSGGPESILVKTFTFLSLPARVIVLKDSFCDYSNAVILWGDQVVNAQEVKDLS